MLKNFNQFVFEKISNNNKEPADHLAHYLHHRGATEIKNIPSGEFSQYKSPKAFGLSCKYGDFKYYVWLDFDEAEVKLEYHVQDATTVKKGEPLKPINFTTATEAAEYICERKLKQKQVQKIQK